MVVPQWAGMVAAMLVASDEPSSSSCCLFGLAISPYPVVSPTPYQAFHQGYSPCALTHMTYAFAWPACMTENTAGCNRSAIHTAGHSDAHRVPDKSQCASLRTYAAVMLQAL